MMKLGMALKIVRTLFGAKQREFAARLDYTEAHISNIENGHQTVTMPVLLRYAEMTNFTVSSIVYLAEQLKVLECKPQSVLTATGKFLTLIEQIDSDGD